MLVDHGPVYPMNGFVRLRFSGALDPDILEAALQTALRDHPLLTCIAQQRARHWYWIPSPAPIHVQKLATTPGPELPNLRPLDVCSEPGVRVYTCGDGQHTDLVLQAHHAASDGLGVLRFAEDLLVHYALASPELPTPPAPVRDNSRLRQRHRVGLTRAQFWWASLRQVRAWNGVLHYLMRTPHALTTSGPADDEASPGPLYPRSLNWQFNAQETASLRAAAGTRGVSLNDLLIHTLYSTIGARQPPPERATSPWIRVCVAVGFRPAGSVSAINHMSLAFLNRRASHVDDSPGFLQGIHREMRRIRRNKLGLAFLHSVALGRFVGGLSTMVRARQCQATAVLSNAGRLFDQSPLSNEDGKTCLGSTTLECVDFLPPIRPETNITLAAHTYAGALRLTLHYDAFALDSRQSQALLNDFVERLEGITHPSAPAPPPPR